MTKPPQHREVKTRTHTKSAVGRTWCHDKGRHRCGRQLPIQLHRIVQPSSDVLRGIAASKRLHAQHLTPISEVSFLGGVVLSGCACVSACTLRFSSFVVLVALITLIALVSSPIGDGVDWHQLPIS